MAATLSCARHGYTGSHHFAGRNPAHGSQPGSWDGLIGPGKAIDTDKLFVVTSNMLGSSFGSTNAGNINPQTGEAYSVLRSLRDCNRMSAIRAWRFLSKAM